MAYEIIGNVFQIGATEVMKTKNGDTFHRRSIILYQKRFDQNTGQEYEPNYPTFDFTQNKCAELDRFKQGDRVKIRFDISGVKYKDKQTGEIKYFNSLRAFKIEPFVVQQPQAQQYAQQPVAQPQYPGYPPQTPFPPQNGIDPETGLPF